MALTFKKTSSKGHSTKKNTVYLKVNNWDDYSFKTTFDMTVVDSDGESHYLGDIKIGFVGQDHSWTRDELEDEFSALDEKFFSLGQGVEFYKKVRALPHDLRSELLIALRDVVHDGKILRRARDESVFRDSLLRTINFATITKQFKRVLDGGAALTEFHFGYEVTETSDRAGFRLQFDVLPNVKPSRNVHVLIGRNGVGKTTLLNGMITSLVEQKPPKSAGRFIDLSDEDGANIKDGYFAGLVSVSFSAFDPFTPPPDKDNAATEDLRYSYIGLKKIVVNPDGSRSSEHKDLKTFAEDFNDSLLACLGSSDKTERWRDAIHYLESDENFADMDLCRFLEINDSDLLSKRARKAFEKMSSGHAMVLLTITKLVEKTGEKTLVIIDEPESHLHPPLLSAFIRSLSELLNKTNGVAIIATHSPVVLQEVPKSCAWKLYRTRLDASSERPELETFGENVGVLTRDVFGLEATKSGFHKLLTESVSEGKDYDQILEDYDKQLGFEGRALLRALVANRNKEQGVV